MTASASGDLEDNLAGGGNLEFHVGALELQVALSDARLAHALGFPVPVIRENDACLVFAGLGAATSQVNSEGSEQVECAPLDSMGVVAPTYVKIDVEGAEAEVLAGAAGTLGRWKPTVAIASYHRPKDLFDLPLWLAAVAPDYRFYLRSHGDAGIDLVCYAVREPAAV